MVKSKCKVSDSKIWLNYLKKFDLTMTQWATSDDNRQEDLSTTVQQIWYKWTDSKHIRTSTGSLTYLMSFHLDIDAFAILNDQISLHKNLYIHFENIINFFSQFSTSNIRAIHRTIKSLIIKGLLCAKYHHWSVNHFKTCQVSHFRAINMSNCMADF